MQLKVNYILLGSILPGVAFILGLTTLHRTFTMQPPAHAAQIKSPGLILSVTPQQIAMNSSKETRVSEEPAERWKLFDPNSLKGDHRIWINTEVLFLQSNMGSFCYGTESSSTTSIQNGEVRSPHFDWNPSFRVGVGYKIPHDNWDLFANYTYLQGHAHGSASHDDSVVFPMWATNFGSPPINPFYADSAKINWNVHANIADLELGRNCNVSKWLSIRPFVGVRGMTMDQHSTIRYNGGTVAPGDTDKVTLSNDYWGVGPRMGFNSLWGLGKGFSLYGNASASLLSGDFDVHEKEKLINAQLQKMNIESRVNNVVVDADLSLGVQWDYMFSQDRYHFGFKLGWEFDMFFNQNQLFNFAGPNMAALRSQNEDLSFQGVTLGFRFDF